MATKEDTDLTAVHWFTSTDGLCGAPATAPAAKHLKNVKKGESVAQGGLINQVRCVHQHQDQDHVKITASALNAMIDATCKVV